MPQKYGYLANAENVSMSCLVCDTPKPVYSWTDYYGEAYCIKCGTPYQLREPSGAKPNQVYPHCKIKEEFIPLLRQYWQETKRGNGLGTFIKTPENPRTLVLGSVKIKRDYPDQLENRQAFNEWTKEHKPEK